MMERRYASKLASFTHASNTAGPSDDEVKYLLQTMPYIKQYYETEEHTAAPSKPGGLSSFCKVDGRTQRNAVFHRYLLDVEKDVANVNFEKIIQKDTAPYSCKACNTALILDATWDELVCPKCGISIRNNNMQLTYEQEQNSTTLITSFSYKRLNHLTETLNAVCNIADVDVPQEVVQAVRAEYMRTRALTRDDITPQRTRLILKQLRLNKHYEHAYAITKKLNGISPPQISKELFEEFQRRFLQIQKPFERVCPSTRRNFLSYTYTCHQLAKLIGRPDLCEWFPLLKSGTKLYEQDCMWRDITSELNWPFHPTC